MSLNNREIDQILDELDLEGSRIDKIHQPDRFSLYFETWKPGHKRKILIGLHPGAVRIREISAKQEFPPSPFRMTQLLRSRIKNGIIHSVSQPYGERILHFLIHCRHEQYNLWVRLWSGNPNIILTNSHNEIIDVLFRKTEVQEIQGFLYEFNKGTLPNSSDNKKREIRDYKPYETLSSYVDYVYNQNKGLENFEREKEKTLRSYDKKILSRQKHLSRLQVRFKKYSQWEEIQNKGKFIQANLWNIKDGQDSLEAQDYTKGEMITISLDKNLSPSENAEVYFKKYKKYQAALENCEKEINSVHKDLANLLDRRNDIENIENESELNQLKAHIHTASSSTGPQKAEVGLRFQSNGFQILVGRNSKENDELLRKYVKGHDLWMHMRQFPGGFVFIKCPHKKSIPLETMLDGANLALLYSNGKKGLSGDVHYTEVKNLRRIKKGKPGQVIVNHDKNLHVRFDEQRIRRLQGKENLETPL